MSFVEIPNTPWERKMKRCCKCQLFIPGEANNRFGFCQQTRRTVGINCFCKSFSLGTMMYQPDNAEVHGGCSSQEHAKQVAEEIQQIVRKKEGRPIRKAMSDAQRIVAEINIERKIIDYARDQRLSMGIE